MLDPLKGEAMSNDVVQRFFGGSPLWVLVRLVLLSILVGVVLAAFGLDPWNIWRSLQRFVHGVWAMGWDAVETLWRYFLLGAVVVVPVWLLGRLVKGTRRA